MSEGVAGNNQQQSDRLLEACENNNIEEARRLLSTGRIDVNYTDSDGDSALSYACGFGHLNIARMLLQEFGADANLLDKSGWTALMYACKSGHIDVARMLLGEFGADVNIKNNHGWTALIYACRKGHVDLARMLIGEFGADVNATENYGDTALMWACRYRHLEVARMLLVEFRADYRLTNNSGQTVFDRCKASSKAELEEIIASMPPLPQSLAVVVPIVVPPENELNSINYAVESVNVPANSSRVTVSGILRLKGRLGAAIAERDVAVTERDRTRIELERALLERDQLIRERDVAILERDQAVGERDLEFRARIRAIAERDQAITERDLAIIERDEARTGLANLTIDHQTQLSMQPFRIDKRYLLRNPRVGVAGTLYRYVEGSPLFEYARRLCLTGGSMYPRQQEVQGFRLVAVDEIVHHPDQVATFEGRLQSLERLRTTGGNHFNFATNSFAGDQFAVLTALRRCFHEPPAGQPPRRINTLYCFHGPRREHLESICQTGLVAVSAMDAGFFGSGCYTTLNIEYAARYAFGDFDSPTRRPPTADGRYPVVMFAAAVGMAYPITPGVDYTEGTNGGYSNYFGRPLRPGFDLHCVCVSEGNGWQAVTRNFCQYMELVMSQQSDLLPIAVLWFDHQ